MNFPRQTLELSLTATSVLPVCWSIAVAIFFIAPYHFRVKEGRRAGTITRERVLVTAMVGTLVVLGTYADALSSKVFELRDCLMLAMVAANGWMADDLFETVVGAVRKRRVDTIKM